MNRSLSVILLAFVATTASAQDSGARARAALALASSTAPPELTAPAFPRWDDAVAAKKKPTVVFVGTPARIVPGMIVCAQAVFPDVPGASVIVAVLFTDETMRRVATLPATATDAEIRRVAGLEVQPIAADPFDSEFKRGQPTARPDRPDAGNAVGPRYHSGHSCPSCGRTQTVISGAGPVRGTHTHSCPKCGVTWYH